MSLRISVVVIVGVKSRSRSSRAFALSHGEAIVLSASVSSIVTQSRPALRPSVSASAIDWAVLTTIGVDDELHHPGLLAGPR